MALPVLYDACVLWSAPLGDLLLRLAARGLVRARWTDEILDECFASLLLKRPDLDREALRKPARTLDELLKTLEGNGMNWSVARVRASTSQK